MVAFSCRRCHTVLEVEDALSGEEYTCPACGQGVLVPYVIPLEQSADPHAPTLPMKEIERIRKEMAKTPPKP